MNPIGCDSAGFIVCVARRPHVFPTVEKRHGGAGAYVGEQTEIAGSIGLIGRI